MDISEVRVKLVRDPGERLKAVCIITFDEAFVVRDVKVVDGTNGLFVAMPSQKLAVHCPSCRQKNHLRARYCNECGKELPSQSIPSDANGRSRLHRDIAHPIRASFREQLQERVIQAYQDEVDQDQSSDVEVETAAIDARPEEPVERQAEEPVERQAEEPVELPADEPVDRPVDQPAPELDDYGAMIANLRGRSTGSSAARKSTGFGPDLAETEKKSTGSSRSSSGQQRRDREPTPEDRPRDPVEREPAMATESNLAEEVAPEPQIETPSKRDAPGPTQDEKPDPAADHPDAGAQDTPFGDGIL